MRYNLSLTLPFAEARALQAKVSAGDKLAVRWEGGGYGRHKLIGDWGACAACTMVRVGIGVLLVGYAVSIFP
jgi:hypothetical protein